MQSIILTKTSHWSVLIVVTSPFSLKEKSCWSRKPPGKIGRNRFWKGWWGSLPAARSSHRSAMWGPHQRGSWDDAFATTRTRLCHELAWILKVFWEGQRDAVTNAGCWTAITGEGCRPGCAAGLDVKPTCPSLDTLFSYSVIMVELNVFGLPNNEKKFPRFKIVCNSFHGNKVASLLHRRACAVICVFIVVGVTCTKQVSWAPTHVQFCTLHRCRSTPVYIFAKVLSAGYVQVLVFAQPRFVH